MNFVWMNGGFRSLKINKCVDIQKLNCPDIIIHTLSGRMIVSIRIATKYLKARTHKYQFHYSHFKFDLKYYHSVLHF